MSDAIATGPPPSPECALAALPGYQDLHAQCRQVGDVPLPFAIGILLQRRCGCRCHAGNTDAPAST
ncbi:hypothetical protein ABZ848_07055 [Streptomyces sp. NPDC047081]|uniref:hypothetical protein n=1 Tax=Streptomyces sp. NPDC047081 TaxID=3154706 RepID=UPI0033DBDBBC